jgi:hypothetical protein
MVKKCRNKENETQPLGLNQPSFTEYVALYMRVSSEDQA